MESKEHPVQIDAVLLLQNGDIAVSGGPSKYEILIYRHDYLTEMTGRDDLILVDALDTGNEPTIQMFETTSKYIIVAQQNSFLVFRSLFQQEDSYINVKAYGQMGPRKSGYVFLQHFNRCDSTLALNNIERLPESPISFVPLVQYKDRHRFWLVGIEYNS